MTTSRTGTGKYRRNRARALRQAQDNNLTNCPICNTPLDYHTSTNPNSAVPDHIISHKFGGTDNLDNLRIICATCNKKRGDGTHPFKPTLTNTHFTTSRDWLT